MLSSSCVESCVSCFDVGGITSSNSLHRFELNENMSGLGRKRMFGCTGHGTRLRRVGRQENGRVDGQEDGIDTSVLSGEFCVAVREMMKSLHYFRYHMLLCYRKRMSVQETFLDINKVAENVVCKKTISRWFKVFEGSNIYDLSLEDLPRSGRPRSLTDTAALDEAIVQDGSKTSRSLAIDFNVSHATITRELERLDVGYRHPPAVPYDLQPKHREKRRKLTNDLLQQANTTGFFDSIITCDETMIPLTTKHKKREWCVRASPANAEKFLAQRAARVKRNEELGGPAPGTQTKFMLSVFWNSNGVVHLEMLDKNKTLDANGYQDQLKVVAKKLKNTLPKFYLLHDNCPAHRAKATKAVAEQLGMVVLTHPAYSPDLAPTDYHFFRALKQFLSRRRFQDKKEALAAVQEFIDSRNASFWHEGIHSLHKRWAAVVEDEGGYPSFAKNELALIAPMSCGIQAGSSLMAESQDGEQCSSSVAVPQAGCSLAAVSQDVGQGGSTVYVSDDEADSSSS